MEKINGGDYVLEQPSPPANVEFEGERSVLSSSFFLDQFGEVVLTLNSAGLSWKLAESIHDEQFPSTCLGIELVPKSENHIKFCDVYAVEFINWGLVQGSVLQSAASRLLGHDLEMYRFTVHAVQRSQSRPSLLVLTPYTFGHKDLQTCQTWVNQLNAYLNLETGRPTSLLVFVHPMSGKGNGRRTWEAVAPIFSRAKVKTKVTVTQRAGQAFDVMASITNEELNSYDGVVAVEKLENMRVITQYRHLQGGDGFFNEILNGLLSSKHKAPYPPAPADFIHTLRHDGNHSSPDENETVAEPSYENEVHSPLLPSLEYNKSRFSNLSTQNDSGNKGCQDHGFTIPNEWFRFGIIPAGSTDAIVICTTGARDPTTSALHIVLGKKVSLDIAQVVRWKTTPTSNNEPCVRYAASFAGYGFYGDVITESEKHRWMGPKRYDYAGTKVFLKHRSYEAEVACLEVKTEETHSTLEESPLASKAQALGKSEKVVCRVNCRVCNTKSTHVSTGCPTPTHSHLKGSTWLKFKGRFLSIGAAIISCRNERAPDGLVADAHLSDGFLHLILIKDCPHAFYLWHLTELARKNGKPLKFDFVEHHKTPAFTFTSSGSESVWNLDGELFRAHKLSAQVFQGLVSLFAPGPEI